MASEDNILVSIVCQRCAVPLKLDESLQSINEHITAELNIPIHSSPEIDLLSQVNSFDHYIAPSDSGPCTNGFMLVTQQQDRETLGQQYRIQTTLFDTLSNNSNIDHPLCDECTDYLIEILEQELRDAQTDIQDYMAYQNELKDAKEPDIHQLEEELGRLELEEQEYLKELATLKNEEDEVRAEIAKQEEETKRISLEEERYLQEYATFQMQALEAEEESKSLQCQIANTQQLLDKLKRTNVFNATFHIWHKDQFGTINNFCLGRLPCKPVDWSEINAAWGQTALLLSALARKINLTFERYRLVPFGNHSFIEVIGENREFPLYGTGGFRFLWDTKFDSGMAAFLDCLQQFQERVESSNKQFCFPYRTKKGKIEDNDSGYSIKIQLNSEEQWTKAMKFMLTNLKWGLAWISSQLDNEEKELAASVES